MRLLIAERVHNHHADACWHLGAQIRRRVWIAHVSIGRPVWMRPDLGVTHGDRLTIYRAGWLLLAVQVATRPIHP